MAIGIVADGTLAFFASIEDALNTETPDLLICSHALQYFEHPYSTLRGLVATEPNALVLHELPLGHRDRIFVQTLRKELGGYSFPAHILSDFGINQAMMGYDMTAEMPLPVWAPFAEVRQVARAKWPVFTFAARVRRRSLVSLARHEVDAWCDAGVLPTMREHSSEASVVSCRRG
jgi:putative methyltransferase (TIGR04325 family)